MYLLILFAFLLCKSDKSLSCVELFETAWTVTCQAALSMKFSRQEYWSGLPFLSPGDLPDPEFELRSPALQADSLPPESAEKPPPPLFFFKLCTLLY